MHETGHFSTKSGMSLFEQRWLPEVPVRAHVVLLHGFGDHSSRYGYVAERLNAAGIAVHAYDQRGHGGSPGRRAYIARFETLLDDLDDYLAHIGPELADAPWFFMGHSMGGMVLARYGETRQCGPRGMIFSSPFLGMNPDVSPLLLKLASILSVIAPWLPVGQVDNTGLSRDLEMVQAADTDPLTFHGRVAARTGAEFHRIIQLADREYEKINMPALVFHGSQDRVVPPSGSQKLYDGLGSADKTLKFYEGGFHELWNDLCKKEVLDDILNWVEKRLGEKAES
jgi:alpha-beta hydrolase superfamily lysophospholipase